MKPVASQPFLSGENTYSRHVLEFQHLNLMIWSFRKQTQRSDDCDDGTKGEKGYFAKVTQPKSDWENIQLLHFSRKLPSRLEE